MGTLFVGTIGLGASSEIFEPAAEIVACDECGLEVVGRGAAPLDKLGTVAHVVVYRSGCESSLEGDVLFEKLQRVLHKPKVTIFCELCNPYEEFLICRGDEKNAIYFFLSR